jgi:hypothetical protein
VNRLDGKVVVLSVIRRSVVDLDELGYTSRFSLKLHETRDLRSCKRRERKVSFRRRKRKKGESDEP